MHNIRPADKFDSILLSSSTASSIQRTADKERNAEHRVGTAAPAEAGAIIIMRGGKVTLCHPGQNPV